METHRVHLHGIKEFRGADWIKVRPFHEQRIQKAIPLLTSKDICRPFLDLFGQSLCLSCIGASDYRLDSDRFCLGNFDSRREPNFALGSVVPAGLPPPGCAPVELERCVGEIVTPITKPIKIPAASNSVARTIELSMNR